MLIRGVYICWGPAVQIPLLDGVCVWAVYTKGCVRQAYLYALVTATSTKRLQQRMVAVDAVQCDDRWCEVC